MHRKLDELEEAAVRQVVSETGMSLDDARYHYIEGLNKIFAQREREYKTLRKQHPDAIVLEKKYAAEIDRLAAEKEIPISQATAYVVTIYLSLRRGASRLRQSRKGKGRPKKLKEKIVDETIDDIDSI